MPKYRLLTSEELNEFEKEFVDFLVVNGIEPEKWVYLKENDPESVDKIIELFSDVILESVLRRVNHLEMRTSRYVQAIHCLPDKMISIALQDEEGDKTASGSENKREDSLSLFSSEQEYKEDREVEIFNLLQKGYSISNGELFKKLQAARSGSL